jgi:hypothetical protein
LTGEKQLLTEAGFLMEAASVRECPWAGGPPKGMKITASGDNVCFSEERKRSPPLGSS